MLNLKGLATGIGSLPHKDATSALDLIFKYTPKAPFWPQLPKRDIREGMVAQFSEGLPCIKIKSNGLVFDAQNKERELENFYEHLIANDVDYFKISHDFAQGLHAFYQRLEKRILKEVEFIKCQITGPFTFAASINDNQGVALLHNSVFMQAILKGLAMKALWQIKIFEKFDKRIVLFLDEPYLGCFGSAYTPINREDVLRGLTEFSNAINSEDVLIGVHCCGNTDWSIFTDIPNIKIISFDAFEFMDRFILYAESLKGLVRRGGIVCWGIVPTQLFSGEETVELLIRKIREGINILVKKGIPEDLLINNLIISPSCGLGTFSPEKADKVFNLLAETSLFIKKTF